MRLVVFRMVLFVLILAGLAQCAGKEPTGRWSRSRADAWYNDKGWLVGCNFNPSTAINQLEMWQDETFDTATIDRELGWAEEIGFNSIRVYLHDLLWKQDRRGFLERMETFLEIAERHGIGVVFVLLDGVWDPFPKLGKQREPKPHVHNSGWVQSPGVEILKDPARHDELQGYIEGTIRHFRNDRRIHAWDLFNEPDNMNRPAYVEYEPENKAEYSLMLLKKAFSWARQVNPSQPITAAPWRGDWSSDEKLSAMDRFILGHSDIITYHCYSNLDEMKKRVEWLKRYGRPILCTEYMARPSGSTFENILPYLKDQNVGAYNWGFVAGKTQTIYPWASWTKTYTKEPPVWFHDILRKDGSAFDPAEVKLIQRLTGKSQSPSRRTGTKTIKVARWAMPIILVHIRCPLNAATS
jgi:hypothetical protein